MTDTPTAYLAGRYSRWRELQAYRDDLKSIGIHVRARWVNGDHETLDKEPTHQQARGFALDDIEDLAGAQIFIGFTEGPGADGRARGGRHVEFGMALERHVYQQALGQRPIRIFVVGPGEKLFHLVYRFVEVFNEWRACYRYRARDLGAG